jgi:hypothetical protein
MILTAENYFSPEMNMKYMSVSQYKSFMPELGGCEAAAMAELKGEYRRPLTKALLVGSFVDAYFEGTLKGFMNDHPDIFTKKNTLRSEFQKANEIIGRVKRDPLFMKFLSGEKQKIFTAKLFDIEWKIKIDSYYPSTCITDLKVVRNFKSMTYWRYDIQGAVYQEVVDLNAGGRLPFYLAAATKERVANFDIFQVPQDVLNGALREVEYNIPHIMDVKTGKVEPVPCGVCDYCKSIKHAEIKDYNELILGGSYAISENIW